jgi:hypothetical protein
MMKDEEESRASRERETNPYNTWAFVNRALIFFT